MKVEKSADLYSLWGNAIQGGFTPIPNELFRNQKKLGIDAIDFNLIANLIRFWWVKDRLPFPSLKVMSEETGISEADLMQHLERLEKKGYVTQKIVSPGVTGFDLAGLVKELGLKREERFTN